MAAKRQAKKQTKKPAVVRGEPVVRCVLSSTLEEIARVGYRALRVDDVAARAGVNKTTIYRRWPEKIDLVRAALSSMAEAKSVVHESGSIREDLLALGRTMREFVCGTEGACVVRMLMAERGDPDLMAIEKSLREAHQAGPLALVRSAVERGEVSPDLDPRILLDTFSGALHHRLFMNNEPVDDGFLTGVVDLLLCGALVKPARRSARAAR